MQCIFQGARWSVGYCAKDGVKEMFYLCFASQRISNDLIGLYFHLCFICSYKILQYMLYSTILSHYYATIQHYGDDTMGSKNDYPMAIAQRHVAKQ